MRTSAPTLLPLFRSQLQGRLLAILYAEPDRERAISELAGSLDAHVATVHREVDRLERAGILVTRHVGRTKVVGPNHDSPFERELSLLVLKAFGPIPIIAGLLARVPGIQEAHVFGSWAERYHGIQGAAPRDVDVFVVGRPDRDEIYRAAAEAERLTGIPVDIVIRSPEAWERQDEGLARTVRSGPRVTLDLGSP